jgi:RimJ/RimL family protein N-acetyltransferase
VPPFADKPTLTGKLVTLRPVTEADAPALHGVHPDTAKLTGSHREVGLDEAVAWYRTRAGHDDRLDLAIVPHESGEWAGEAVINEYDPDSLSANFRILLAGPQAYGRGWGTEATRLILGYAFEHGGLHRIDLGVYDFNPRARRVYEKVGFRYEGTRRESLCWDGAWVDEHIMSILDREWAEHRGHP